MIVADANLIIYLVRESPLTALAREVYARDPDWAVPELWEAEVLSGLMCEVRAGYLDMDDALRASSNAAAVLAGRVHKCDRQAVLHAARAADLTAYDAYYVTLARSLNLNLVTEDRKVVRRCPHVALSMKEFLAGGRDRIREQRATYHARRKK